MLAVFLQFGESCIVGTIIDLSLNRFSYYQILAVQLKVSLVGMPQVVMADRAQAYRQHRELTESSKLKELNLYTRLASSLQFYVCLHEKGPTKNMIFGSLGAVLCGILATHICPPRCKKLSAMSSTNLQVS